MSGGPKYAFKASTSPLAVLFFGIAIIHAAISGAISPLKAETQSCSGWRSKVVGGRPAAIKSWPTQAALRLFFADASTHYICGGMAVSEYWVLTAGHCVYDFTSKRSGPWLNSEGERLEVVLGAGNLKTVTKDNVFQVEQVVVHEKYQAAVFPALANPDLKARKKQIDDATMATGDDIALIRLSDPWKGEMARLSLVEESDPQSAGVAVRTAGFGMTEKNLKQTSFLLNGKQGEMFVYSPQLNETTIKTISLEECAGRAAHDNWSVRASQICVEHDMKGGRGAHSGDSGGPLVMEGEDGCANFIGVMSLGTPLDKKNKTAPGSYGVYTRISHYAQWIQDHVGPLAGAPLTANAAAPDRPPAVSRLAGVKTDLEKLLRPVKGRVRVGVKGGNRVKLGQMISFEAESAINGRLFILDIGAGGEVTQIYPSRFAKPSLTRRIKAGERITVPNSDYEGFPGFRVQGPAGIGSLLAVVAPEDCEIGEQAAAGKVQNKNFAFASPDAPLDVLEAFAAQIKAELGGPADGNGAALQRWGYGSAEYEVTR